MNGWGDTRGGPGHLSSPRSESKAPVHLSRDTRHGHGPTQRPPREPRFIRPHPPPLSPSPPSPNISKHLEEMAKAHGIVTAEHEPKVSVTDVQELMNKINATEQLFRGNEAHIWEKQYEEQKQLLEKHIPKAVLLKKPELSVKIEDGGLRYLEHVVTFGPGPDDLCSLEPGLTDHQPIAKVIPITVEEKSGEKAPEDPRLQYVDQYKELSSWLAMHKFSVPDFAGQGIEKDDHAAAANVPSPSFSWSHSPEREGTQGNEGANSRPPQPPSRQKEATSMKRRPSLKDFQQEGLLEGSQGPSSQDEPQANVLYAPSAPAHNNVLGGLSSRTASVSSLSLKPGPLDVEEGFFIVSLPDGTSKRAPFRGLLSLVNDGSIPKSWPAYREEDQLWLPLQENISLEDLRSKQLSIYRPISACDASSLSVWDDEVGNEGGLDDLKAWLRATVLRCLPPRGRLTEPIVRRSKQLVIGEQEQQRVYGRVGGGENYDDYDAIKKAAAAAFADQEARQQAIAGLKLGDSLAIPYSGCTLQPAPHVVAAVRAQLLGNRELIRKVAMGALQSALRTHMEGANKPQRKV